MSYNFFAADCTETSRCQKKFGICDDENGAKAYTTLINSDLWGATVLNEHEIPIAFTAIDKCVLKDEDLKDTKRCDGMLTSSIHLYLVELKNVRRDWKNAAYKQLLSTIQLLNKYHPDKINSFKHKKVFACNRQSLKSPFTMDDNMKNKQLYTEYKFRLEYNAIIKMN